MRYHLNRYTGKRLIALLLLLLLMAQYALPVTLRAADAAVLEGYGIYSTEESGDDSYIAIPVEEIHQKTVYGAVGTAPLTIQVQYNQTGARQSLAAINAFRTGEDAWYLDEGEEVGGKKVFVEGLGELEYDYDLERAAMLRAAECLVSRGHTRPNGESCFSAVSDRGNYSWLGENLFYSYGSGYWFPSAEYAIEAWKETNRNYAGQGHRRNMLHGSFTHVGIAGLHYNGMTVWVQEFGNRRTGVSAQTKAADGMSDAVIQVPGNFFSKLSLAPSVESSQTLELTEGQSQAVSAVDTVLTIDSNVTTSYLSSVRARLNDEAYQYSVEEPFVASYKNGTITALHSGETILKLHVSWQGLSADFERKVSVKPSQGVQDIVEKTSAGAGTWIKAANGRWWYQYADKTYPKNTWAKIDGKWYHFDETGYMQTGWLKSGGKWYYLKSSGAMTTGWEKVGSKWYYMNNSGAMQTGWLKSGKTWYYLNKDGSMATGWVKSGNEWYYMNTSGAMQTGWMKVSGKWYYMNSGGDMVTGWKKDKGKWYYLENSGAMLSNTSRKIGNKTYNFDSSGVCTNP